MKGPGRERDSSVSLQFQIAASLFQSGSTLTETKIGCANKLCREQGRLALSPPLPPPPPSFPRSSPFPVSFQAGPGYLSSKYFPVIFPFRFFFIVFQSPPDIDRSFYPRETRHARVVSHCSARVSFPPSPLPVICRENWLRNIFNCPSIFNGEGRRREREKERKIPDRSFLSISFPPRRDAVYTRSFPYQKLSSTKRKMSPRWNQRPT